MPNRLSIGDLNKKDLFSIETVDLMDRTGELVNLAEREQSTDLVSSLLKERESYIPLRVSREFALTNFRYIRYHNNFKENQ